VVTKNQLCNIVLRDKLVDVFKEREKENLIFSGGLLVSFID